MQVSRDNSDLIKEMQQDLVEFGDHKVWVYFVDRMGVELFIDYYELNLTEEEKAVMIEPGETDYTIEDFDSDMEKDYESFIRKQMLLSEAIKIATDQNKTLK